MNTSEDDVRNMSIEDQLRALHASARFESVDGEIDHDFLAMLRLSKDVWDSIASEHSKYVDGPQQILQGPAYCTISAVSSGLGDFDRFRLPQAERKEVGESVEKLCRSLIKEVARIPDLEANHFFFSPQHKVIEWIEAEIERQDQWKRDISFNSEPTIETEKDEAIRRNAITDCLVVACQLATTNIGLILDNLADSARRWADAKQYIAKPNHPNARRLFLIRSLTEHFVRLYGRPMRRETLEIVALFFDCKDLDEAALSKLAPVKHPARNTY